MTAKNNKKELLFLLILPNSEKEILKIADELMEVQRLDDLAAERKRRRKAKNIPKKSL